MVEWDGTLIEAGIFNDILETVGVDAKVLARYHRNGHTGENEDEDAGTIPYYAGEAAVIETKVGAGRIIHFGGTFTRNNIKQFLKYTGVMEPLADIVSVPEECEIALRRKDGQDYLFVLNFDKVSKEIILYKNMVDMDTGEIVRGSVSLKPYGTKVYRM